MCNCLLFLFIKSNVIFYFPQQPQSPTATEQTKWNKFCIKYEFIVWLPRPGSPFALGNFITNLRPGVIAQVKQFSRNYVRHWYLTEDLKGPCRIGGSSVQFFFNWIILMFLVDIEVNKDLWLNIISVRFCVLHIIKKFKVIHLLFKTKQTKKLIKTCRLVFFQDLFSKWREFWRTNWSFQLRSKVWHLGQGLRKISKKFMRLAPFVQFIDYNF